MSFSNSRTFQNCCKCYIIFYIAVVYFSILICHFVLVTPCYITCWKNSVFLFFAYSGVSKSPGISKNVLEKSWKLECKSPGKSEKKSLKILESPGIWHKIFCGNPGTDRFHDDIVFMMARSQCCQYFWYWLSTDLTKIVRSNYYVYI